MPLYAKLRLLLFPLVFALSASVVSEARSACIFGFGSCGPTEEEISNQVLETITNLAKQNFDTKTHEIIPDKFEYWIYDGNTNAAYINYVQENLQKIGKYEIVQCDPATIPRASSAAEYYRRSPDVDYCKSYNYYVQRGIYIPSSIISSCSNSNSRLDDRCIKATLTDKGKILFDKYFYEKTLIQGFIVFKYGFKINEIIGINNDDNKAEVRLTIVGTTNEFALNEGPPLNYTVIAYFTNYSGKWRITDIK